MRYLIVAIMLMAVRVEAQSLDTLYVGKAHLSADYMRNDSSESDLFVPGQSAPVGHSSTRQRVVQDHGKPVLFRVAHFKSARAEVTDSIMTEGAGLVPVWEISHQTSKVMHLKWNGRRVTGDVTPTGKAAESIDQTMAVAPFNSSDIELLVGSLPLAKGYRALVATYEYESGGLRLDTLAVTGRENNAWVVRMSRGDSSAFTLWVDGQSHVRQFEIESGHTWQARVVTIRHDASS